MTTDYVNKLVSLAAVTNPCEQPTAKDWQALETEIGGKFPTDYKSLVSQLGSGDFGCGLSLYNPCSSSEYTRLSRESLISRRETIQDLEEKLGAPVFPSPNGMVVIASIDSQDFCFRPQSVVTKHLSDLVWLSIDAEEILPVNLTFSQFIHDLYFGLISDSWAKELGTYIWRDGDSTFFASRKGGNGRN